TQVYKLPCVVAINAFPTDTKAELDLVEARCKELGVNVALSEVWAKGGEGGIALAKKVLETLEKKESHFRLLYQDNISLKEKIETVAREIYGAGNVNFAPTALKQLAKLEELGFGHFPVCMAKNQYSLSDDPKLLGRPVGFELNIREVYVSAGAGFVVVLTGAVMTMPGLPKQPAAYNIDVDDKGVITGLF
ncbi:MAG: formate--tetrahydrofolate ligase, partial [Acetatifactor sp.]